MFPSKMNIHVFYLSPYRPLSSSFFADVSANPYRIQKSREFVENGIPPLFVLESLCASLVFFKGGTEFIQVQASGLLSVPVLEMGIAGIRLIYP